MERVMSKNLGFVLVTFVLVLLISFCVTETVSCRGVASDRELENYYGSLERELIKKTKDYLGESGFRNSGVMLTKVIEEDGMREYTLTVHHKKMGKLTSCERIALEEQISNFEFDDEKCKFRHKFLITD